MKCIYAIKNKINHKMYIGMTNNYKKRIEYHLYELRHNKHHSKKLQRAFNKYGEDNFEFCILLEVNKMEGLELKEKEYIKEYDTYNNGYNCSEGGEKSPNYKQPENTRIALLKRNKGNTYSLGMKMPQSAKDKISKNNSGKNNGMFGKKHTKEELKKMSFVAKQTWENNYEKMYDKISNANKSIKRRKEVSEQMSGENNFKSKLKEKDVIEIRKRYDNGEKPRFILKDYPQISKSGLMKICLRKTWKKL